MATQIQMHAPSRHVYEILPEQVQEDALHATRLLQVEERAYQRVARALVSKDSLLKRIPHQRPLPSPPPEGEEDRLSNEHEEAFKLQKFREEVLLDFAALESSITRMQLIQSSNQRERERYAAEKAKIMETAQAVRDNAVQLKAQLEDARALMALRKGYDEQAVRILEDKNVNSREESQAEIEVLRKEIDDLENESVEYEGTWVGRREQFDRVVAEGEAMVKLIKGVKDEPEHDKDDIMEDNDDGKNDTSRMGTPAPDARTPRPVTGAETPLQDVGDTEEATPARPVNRFLDVEDGTRPSSRATSPPTSQTDVDMADSARETQPGEAANIEVASMEASQLVDARAEMMDES